MRSLILSRGSARFTFTTVTDACPVFVVEEGAQELSMKKMPPGF